MKFIIISFAALFRCASSSEDKPAIRDASPKLRAGIKKNDGQPVAVSVKEVAAGLVVDERTAKKKKASRTSHDTTSRERISRYVQSKQMFFILDAEKDPIPWLFEDPSVEPHYPNGVQWVCAPTHAPDFNGDGLYDSLVAHAITFIPPKKQEEARKRGATLNKAQFHTHGYSASWADETGYYDEYIIDYDDTSVEHIKGSSVTVYESSPAGGRGGFTASGAGEWAFDAGDHPMIQMMQDALGVESLTPELCAEKYAEAWTAANDPPSSDLQ